MQDRLTQHESLLDLLEELVRVFFEPQLGRTEVALDDEQCRQDLERRYGQPVGPDATTGSGPAESL